MNAHSQQTSNKRPFNPQPANHQIDRIIAAEEHRQRYTIELIASENFVSPAVLRAMGSVLTNKYAEGYPNHRYYHGCENVDAAETAAIEWAKKLFNAKYANVQPHSGSQANEIAYSALVKPGSKIMGMALSAGGHLSHGTKVSFSGKVYEAHQYGVKEDGIMDYDAIEAMARKVQPALIVCGASAYSRTVDFRRFRKIADAVGAYLVADIAHIAGLVATGHHPSPVPYAHVVTTTVHKTLRGARGGLVLCNDSEISKKVNKAAFPGAQGGPLMHIIAGKAVAFHEALQPEFKTYISRVCANAKVLAEEFIRLGAPVVSGGTDNHLLVVDVFTGYKMTGKLAADLLHKVGITLNMNMIPYDVHPPVLASGVRIGTPAMTTRGFGTKEFKRVAQIIDFVLRHPEDEQAQGQARVQVQKLLAPFT